MAWGYVQSVWAHGTASPVQQTLTTTQGNRLLVFVVVARNGATPATPVVTDSLNTGNYNEDAFTVGQVDGAWQQRESWYSMPVGTGGSTTVSVASSAFSVMSLAVLEYSGLDTSAAAALETSASGAGTGGTATTGTTAAPAAADYLAISGYGDDGWFVTDSGATNSGVGWTYRVSNTSATTDFHVQDKLATTSALSATQQVGWPGGTSATWGMVLAVYKIPAAGGATTIGIGQRLGGVRFG